MAGYTFCPLCGNRLETFKIENRDRMRCPADGCGFVHWDNPLPVVAAIIEHDGLVLIARNKMWPEKMFGLITGFLEKGEHPADAVLREVKEETGLEGSIVSLVGVYPFFQRNEIISVYHIRTTGEIRLGDELAEFKLLPAEKVRPWPFGTGPALADWLGARFEKSSK